MANSIDVVIDDIKWPVDGVLSNAPPGKTWAARANIAMGTKPQGLAAPTWFTSVVADQALTGAMWWDRAAPGFVFYRYQGDVPSANTRIQFRGFSCWLQRESTREWHFLGEAPPQAAYFNANITAGYGNAPMRVALADGGGWEFRMPAEPGNNVHGWGTNPGKFFYDITAFLGDIRNVWVTFDARLVLDDINGTDQRHLTKVGGHALLDYYPYGTSNVSVYAPITYAAGSGAAAFKQLTNDWQSFNWMPVVSAGTAASDEGATLSLAARTRTEAEVRAEPPPPLATTAAPAISGTGEVGSLLTYTPGTGHSIAKVFWVMDGVRVQKVHRDVNVLQLAVVNCFGDMQVVEVEPDGTQHFSNTITVLQPGGTPVGDLIDEADRFVLRKKEDWTDGNMARINATAALPAGSSHSYFNQKRWGPDQGINDEKQRFTFAGDIGDPNNPFPSGPSAYSPFAINTVDQYLEMFMRRVTLAEAPHTIGRTWLSACLRGAYAQHFGYIEVDFESSPEGWPAVWETSPYGAEPPEPDMGEGSPKSRPTQMHVNRHMPVTQAQVSAYTGPGSLYSIQDNPNGTGWHTWPRGRTMAAGVIHTIGRWRTPDGRERVYFDGELVDEFDQNNPILEPLALLLTLSMPPDYTDWLDPETPSTPSPMSWKCHGIRYYDRPSEAAAGPVNTVRPLINEGRNALPGALLTAADGVWTGAASVERFWQLGAVADKLSSGSSSFQTSSPSHQKRAVFRTEIATGNDGVKRLSKSLFTWLYDPNLPDVPVPPVEPQGGTGVVSATEGGSIDIAAIVAAALGETVGAQKAHYSNAILTALGANPVIELTRDASAYYQDTCTPTVNAAGDIVLPATFDEPPELNSAADINTGVHRMVLRNAGNTANVSWPLGPSGAADVLVLSSSPNGAQNIRTQDLILKAPATLDASVSSPDVIATRLIAMGSELNEQDLPGVSDTGNPDQRAIPIAAKQALGETTHAEIMMGTKLTFDTFPQWIKAHVTGDLGLTSTTVWEYVAARILISNGAASAHTALNTAIRSWPCEVLGRRITDKQWVLLSSDLLSRVTQAAKPWLGDTGQVVLTRQGPNAEYQDTLAPASFAANGILLTHNARVRVAPGTYDMLAFGLKLQLVPFDALGADDTGAANLLAHVAPDAYPTESGALLSWNPGIGFTSFFEINTTAAWFGFTPISSMRNAHDAQTVTELLANPPPFGVL